ncbi:MAG: hypothetical protein J6R93_05970 [Tidjanibacter sp.]|nr:hypothetical protein [Tidjanibacter sp.]
MFGIGQSLRRKPRQFSYNPRYYDAEREARNQRRIELGHAPLEDDKSERKPGDLLRARSQQRLEKAEREAAVRKKSNMTRVLFVVLLIAGFAALLRSINF